MEIKDMTPEARDRVTKALELAIDTDAVERFLDKYLEAVDTGAHAAYDEVRRDGVKKALHTLNRDGMVIGYLLRDLELKEEQAKSPKTEVLKTYKKKKRNVRKKSKGGD